MSDKYPRLLTLNDPTDPTGKTIVLVHSKEEEKAAIERSKIVIPAVPTGPNTVSNGGVNVDRYGEQLARVREAGFLTGEEVTDPATAAEIIRPEVDRTVAHTVTPEEHRRINFVLKVMSILDLENNPTNFKHVEELLKKHEIDPTGVDEWPKHYYHVDGRDTQVDNEDAVKELGEGWSDNPDAQNETKVKHLEEVAKAPTATPEDKRAATQARAQLTAAKGAPKEAKRAA